MSRTCERSTSRCNSYMVNLVHFGTVLSCVCHDFVSHTDNARSSRLCYLLRHVCTVTGGITAELGGTVASALTIRTRETPYIVDSNIVVRLVSLCVLNISRFGWCCSNNRAYTWELHLAIRMFAKTDLAHTTGQNNS